MSFYRNRRIYFLLILPVIFTLILSACGAGNFDRVINNNMSESVPEEKVIVQTTADTMNYDGANAPTGQEAILEQMMIYQGFMQIEVKDMKEATDLLMSATSQANGYVINSNKSENENAYYAHFEFKIPVKGFNSLISKINDSQIGKITSQNVNGTDVTMEYMDLDSRLKAKKVYEERLLALMDKATKTEDLLKISNDLSRVQEEIEQIKGRQKYLTYHSANSTLVIDLVQYKNKVAPTASSWEKAVDGFNRSIDFVKNLFISLFIWFISALPILILLALVIIITLFILRRFNGRFGTKKSNEQTNNDQ